MHRELIAWGWHGRTGLCGPYSRADHGQVGLQDAADLSDPERPTRSTASAASPSAAPPCCGVPARSTPSEARTSPSCCSERGTAVSATDRTSSPRAVRAAWLLRHCSPPGCCRRGLAQPAAPVVTDADIARARQEPARDHRQATSSRQRKKHRMPTEAELARVPMPSTPQRRRAAAARDAAAGRSRAPSRVATRPCRSPAPPPSPATRARALLVFVSFSMPEAALSRLVDQAARSGATLVLRGFINGSLQQTVGTHAATDRAAQGRVPDRPAGLRPLRGVGRRRRSFCSGTGAMPEPCAAGTCFPTASFVSAAGDVSLDYALEYFKRSAPSLLPGGRRVPLEAQRGRRHDASSASWSGSRSAPSCSRRRLGVRAVLA